MTAFSATTGTVVPAPRAATPRIPTPRRPVDRVPGTPAQRCGRHRSADPIRAQRRTSTTGELIALAARAGSIVTLAAMLVAAAATAGLADGVAPSGDAAKVASSTLR